MDKVKEYPVLFNGDMVFAILEGRKTQTRRVIKSPAKNMQQSGIECIQHRDLGDKWYGDKVWSMRNKTGAWADYTHNKFLSKCPLGKPGDRLWVRETWADTNGESGPMVSYKAGGDRFLIEESYPVDYSRYPNCTFTMWCGDLRRGEPGHSWRPSIHMPRWASRITLEVTEVRAERVQDITEDDAMEEGVCRATPYIENGLQYYREDDSGTYRAGFSALWDSLYSKKGWGWNVNPFVWVGGFRRIDQ